MGFDRLRAEEERGGGLAVRRTACDEQRNLQLLARQRDVGTRPVA
jgi:hypothetical protein